MGIQTSVLNENSIRKIMKENYKIEISKIEKINRGTANIYKIQSKEKKYILKEFSQGRTEESVIKETNIINYLKERNIKVPIYIKSIEGKFYTKYNDRIIVVQEYIEGYTMENNTGNYEKTIESATILGKMTKALINYKGLSEDGIIEKWFSRESLKKGIEQLTDLKSKINDDNPYKSIFEKDIDDKINMSKDLIESFNFDIISKLSIMNSHGDYSVQQLIYNDKVGTTVIDFETAKKLPIIWEVMRSYSYIDEDAKGGNINIETLIDYVKEFSKYITLNKYDLKYATKIYLIQIVSSQFGYKQYNDNYEKTGLLKFALFRTNLCRCLYNNSNNISSRLENINQ